MRYYFFFTQNTSDFRTTQSTTYLQRNFFEHAVIVPFLVHITYKTELLVFPLVKPAVTPSKNNTTCTRSQNLQTPAAALLLYLSQTCSGFSLPACRYSLVQSGFPQPFLEITHRLLGEILRSWRDVTVATILLLLSQLLQHIKLLSLNKMTSFAVELKGTPLLKGFQQNGLCFEIFLLRFL